MGLTPGHLTVRLAGCGAGLDRFRSTGCGDTDIWRAGKSYDVYVLLFLLKSAVSKSMTYSSEVWAWDRGKVPAYVYDLFTFPMCQHQDHIGTTSHMLR